MLKTSHLQTPRSMAEGTWHHGCDPIERPERKPRGYWRWMAFCVFASICLVLIAAK